MKMKILLIKLKQKSKVLAEKEAWSFVETRKKQSLPCFELSVINPVFI